MYSGLKDFVSNFVRAKQLIGLFYLGLKGRKISMVRCSYHTHGRSTTCTPLVSEWEQVIDFFFLCVCVCVCVEKNLLCSFSDGWPIFSEPELEPIIEPVIILIFTPPPPLNLSHKHCTSNFWHSSCSFSPLSMADVYNI